MIDNKLTNSQNVCIISLLFLILIFWVPQLIKVTKNKKIKGNFKEEITDNTSFYTGVISVLVNLILVIINIVTTGNIKKIFLGLIT